MEQEQQNPDKPWLWKTGQSGNPAGRPPEENSLSALLRRKLEEVHPLERRLAEEQKRPERTTKEAIAERLLAKALVGDLRAIETVLNRLEGKPRAVVRMEGEVNHKGEVKHTAEAGFADILIQRLEQLRERPKLQEAVDAEVISVSG